MSEKLNCWPGCLAMIVRSRAGNDGKVVKCKEYLGDVVFHDGVARTSWRIDRRLIGDKGKGTNIVPDGFLTPLRDSEGQDEMLRIAGLPNKETTPAAH